MTLEVGQRVVFTLAGTKHYGVIVKESSNYDWQVLEDITELVFGAWEEELEVLVDV